MYVDEVAKKTVVFVGIEASGKFVPFGTAFLGRVRYEGHEFNFIVTAEHVVDAIKSEEIAIRLNRRSGDAFTVLIKKEEKISGLAASDDLVLFNVPYWHDQYDLSSILLDRAEYESITRDIWKPGVGDEVATVGLYTSHYGALKNIPVVRIGHLAMLPDEPVLTQRGEYLRGYLVEVRSIIGLSGSPVFINMPQTRVVQGKIETREGPGIILIGMMLGYHLVASAEDQIVVPFVQGETPAPEYSLDERNTGFAVVLPIERILDLVESKDFIEAMQRGLSSRKADPNK